MHTFAENKLTKEHNATQLSTVDTQLLLIGEIDENPKDIVLSQSQIDAIKKMSETGNLESQLKLKIDAQVMLTSNLVINDRLVNSLVGTVKQIKYKNNEVSVVYVVYFNDNNAGRESVQSDVTARQHKWVSKETSSVVWSS